MNRSSRAALFVFIALLVALVVGLGLYLRYAEQSGIGLLAACTLTATFLVFATGQLLRRLHKSRKAAEEYGVPESRALHWLSRRQWLTLMVGLTVITLGTGSLTGMRVLAAQDAPVVADPTVAPSTAPATTPPPPTTAAPSPSPSPSVDPTLTPSGSPFETVSPTTGADDSSTLPPEAITYLDSAAVLDGYYDANPVTFSGTRYPRGTSMSCRRGGTAIQWNVAGYARFEAVAGIDDATTNAYGITLELIFYNQDGHRMLPNPVDVSVGHPRKVTFPLDGVVSLRMTCQGRDTRTNEGRSSYLGLGDPVIIRT